MSFWTIVNATARVDAFLRWLETLPTTMVNRLTVPVPNEPAEEQALARLETRIGAWLGQSGKHQAAWIPIDLRILADGWSPPAAAAIRQAAVTLLLLDPVDRDDPGVRLALSPFEALPD